MNFNELLDSYDKKFYKLSEIEKIAEQEAEKHRKQRNFLSKASHALGSQQTAVDVYRDLKREIELRQNEADPLEKISGFVQVLITTKKCDLIVSVKTCEYKDAFNKFLTEYLAETKAFVELQYQEEFGSVLLAHLKDALSVLKERGDVKAEKRLKELPDYEKLLTTYQQLTVKLNSLLIDFSSADLEECASLLHFLKQNELAAKVVKTSLTSLQTLYNKIIYKAQEAVEEERRAMVPSIQSMTTAIANYNNLRLAFSKTEVELGEDSYSSLQEELLTLVDEIKKETQYLLKQENNPSPTETKILDKIVLKLILQKEINDYFVRYNYSYIEIKAEIEKIKKYKENLDDNIGELKRLYLKNIREKLPANDKMSLEAQLSLWQEVEKELALSSNKLNSKNIYFPELANQKSQIPELRKTFVSLKIRKYDSYNHHLNEYKELLETIAAKIPSEEAEEVKITEFINLINFYRVNIKEILQIAKSLEKIIVSQENPLTFYDDFKTVSEFVGKCQATFIDSFVDTSSDVEWLSTINLALSYYINDYIAKHARQGNLYLKVPNSEAKIVLLDKAQVLIGRASERGNLITNNRISLPWSRLSGEHLLIDFQQGLIKDLESTNGSFINKMPSKMKSESLDKITEFNLATDITFQTFYAPTSFSGFVFTNFSTNHDKALPFSSKSRIEDVLNNCFFIYLPPENKEIKLFIRKYDGKPIYGNEMLDYKDCFIIERAKGVFYYSDYQENIISQPILKEANPKFKLFLEEIII